MAYLGKNTAPFCRTIWRDRCILRHAYFSSQDKALVFPPFRSDVYGFANRSYPVCHCGRKMQQFLCFVAYATIPHGMVININKKQRMPHDKASSIFIPAYKCKPKHPAWSPYPPHRHIQNGNDNFRRRSISSDTAVPQRKVLRRPFRRVSE